jgi:hypothetical protein
MVSFALIGSMALGKAPLVTPYRSVKRLIARNLKSDKNEIGLNEPLGFDLDLDATFDNPFDDSDINVRIIVENDKGRSFDVPGYFAVDGSRQLVEGKERIKLATTGRWKARVTFQEPGEYTLSAIVRDRSGTSITNSLKIQAKPSTTSGFIRVSETDKRFFQTTTGKSFYPIGANVCWGGDQGTFNYDRWLDQYAAQGVNFIRLWLSPLWNGFSLELPGRSSEGKGLGVYSQENLWRLDYVMNLARSKGIRVKLCIDSFNVIRDKDGNNNWEDSPHSIANGGVLHSPSEFWESPSMDRIFMQKLRYLVARYGADPTVFAWEFWNEADLSRDFPETLAKDWHQRMATALKKMDPYKHLITTSFADSMGKKEVDLLNELDFIQTHNYSAPDVISQVAIQQSRKGSWGKPHYVGEIGADWAGPRAEDDPTGIQIHDPLWISVCIGSSGAAMPWWWDNYIDPKNLYPLFGSVVRFTDGIQWHEQGFRQTQPKFSWRTPPTKPLTRDLLLSGGPTEWQPSPYNQPRTVKVSGEGFSGQTPVAGILHGKENHPEWHNPVTFQTSFTKPTSLDILVDGVSGYGGAQLAIDLNGSRYLTRDFADPDGNQNTQTITQFNGIYKVTIPAGKQVVKVSNLGKDWMTLSYRFKDSGVRNGPPLISWATVGDQVALAWVRVEDRTWRRLCVLKEVVPPSAPANFTLPGLASGNWTVQLWDTWKGEVKHEFVIRVGLDGFLKLPLPVIETDLAIKAIRKEKGS